VRQALGEAIEQLRPAARDVAWVAPDNLHLTLKFLGAVPEARIDSVAGALTDASREAGSFEARIRGLGAFPSAGRPRVVWAGVTDEPGKIINVYQPAGKMEEFFRAVGKFKGLPSRAEVMRKTYTKGQVEATHRLFNDHGMDVLGPPLTGK